MMSDSRKLILRNPGFLTVDDFEPRFQLFFDSNEIRVLDHNVFSRSQITETLSLHSNLIRKLENDVFSNLTRLTTLNLRNNTLKILNPIVFENLQSLSELDLSYNMIDVLVDNCLTLPRLHRLCLNFNKISVINDRAFESLPSLIELNLACNLISGELSGNLFKNNHVLSILNLENNQIRSLGKNIFDAQILLKKIYLANNLIDSIANVFVANSQLLELDLTSNLIESIEFENFSNLCLLQKLKLNVENFEFASIANLKSLEDFELKYHGEKRFRLDTNFFQEYFNASCLTKLTLVVEYFSAKKKCDFSILKQLEKLSLECVHKRKIKTKINLNDQFSTMIQLREIILKNLNKFKISGRIANTFRETIYIERLTLIGLRNITIPDFFVNFSSLIHLNLSFSRIKNFDYEIFKYLPKLETLNLSYTRIRHIHKNDFLYCSKVTELLLNNSEIKVIEDDAFAGLLSIETLNLRNNSQLTITTNTFRGLKEGVYLLFNSRILN